MRAPGSNPNRSSNLPSSIPALTHPSSPPPTWRIALNLLDHNPHQPRSQMDEATLAELMASIRDHGLLQPITVRKVGIRYQVIAGHRRLEAFRRLLAEAQRQDQAMADRFGTIPAHRSSTSPTRRWRSSPWWRTSSATTCHHWTLLW